jgi:hypothetical protein
MRAKAPKKKQDVHTAFRLPQGQEQVLAIKQHGLMSIVSSNNNSKIKRRGSRN